jgi:hypothetical protein
VSIIFSLPRLQSLWQQQGKRAEAYDLLASTSGWFIEGFDTATLQEAKALLNALEANVVPISAAHPRHGI